MSLILNAEVGEQVYNSNAIENSTLTLEETEKILLQIDLDRYIGERELFEAKNLARVMSYIEPKSHERPLDKDMMLLLHTMLITNIRDNIAGRFRNADEWVRVGSYIAPNPVEIDGLLSTMLSTYAANATENVVTRIAAFHLAFERIHPFVDGNGRMGRALNNYLLFREGYVPITILYATRETYYEAFQEFESKGTQSIMESLIGLALQESYHKRLAYLEGKRIVTLSEYSKITNASLSSLLNKAKRQTIEAFREKGVWKIGT